MTPDGWEYFCSGRLFIFASDWPAHPRHMDMIWLLWNVFDVTPEGHGEVWVLKLTC